MLHDYHVENPKEFIYFLKILLDLTREFSILTDTVL